MSSKIDSASIAIIGLGYVGLPLAIAFGKQRKVVGYDINKHRIKELQAGIDKSGETATAIINEAAYLTFTHYQQDIQEANVYIITVPTPIDPNHQPDLTPLKEASKLVGSVLAVNDIVIYESTVYPGATEEDCIPVLEQSSGLAFNKDFHVGYSPERINPGDKERTLTTIKKITSGSTPSTANFVDELYNSIITAGTHKVSSIKAAEAAKVIENTQRDLNIALINELAIIFDYLHIDTEEVLEAAATKWNFLPFKPGLVGGHCIGIDPYYLTHKAESLGYHPDVILAGRKINDGMGKYVVNRLVREMIQQRLHVNGSKILIMGFAFKEDCSDIRNTKVVDIVCGLEQLGAEVAVYDPVVNNDEVVSQHSVPMIVQPQENYYDAIIIAVAHKVFRDLNPEQYRQYTHSQGLIYDLKHIIDAKHSDLRL